MRLDHYEMAQQHEQRHYMCQAACALMRPEDAIRQPDWQPCGGICQALRWELLTDR